MSTAFRFNLPSLLAQFPTGLITVSVLAVDASRSMEQYGNAPELAVNGYLDELRRDATQHHATCIVTFADDYRVDVPLTPVTQLGRYHGYETRGSCTLLYRTAKRVIEGLTDAWDALTPEQQKRIRIVVSTISDGADNHSPKADYPEALVGWSQRARRNGAELMAMGVGIDGPRLAAAMGFDPALAKTMEATVAGVELATRTAADCVTRRA